MGARVAAEHFLRQLVTTSAPNSYRTIEDGTVVAPAGAVLANDTDVDGDALVTVRAALAEHGTVAPGRDGSFTYTPATNWSGTDGFDYVVEDGNGSAERARVTVVVDPVNDASGQRPARVAQHASRHDRDVLDGQGHGERRG